MRAGSCAVPGFWVPYLVICRDLTLQIEKIAAGGEGIARFEGKTIFVGMSAPGEKVRCRVTEDHGSWARAEPLEVIDASPCRVTPACAFYGKCGGCDLQHLSYHAQIEAKTSILTDSFRRIGGFEPPRPTVFPSEPWEYRNRTQLHCVPLPRGGVQADGVSYNGLLGFKARKSGDIVPVSDCPVADPAIREILRKSGRGEGALTPPPCKERFTVYGRNGLLLYEGGEREPRTVNREPLVRWFDGSTVRRGKTRLLGRDISLDVSVFFQSNGAMLEKLIAGVKEAASRCANGAERRMADLYSGVGTFASFLSESFTHIDLMEENKHALILARENLAAGGAAGAGAACAGPNPHVEFFALRDTEWTKTRRAPYGFVVADPPRQGLAPALAHRLAETGPPVLAYVSCAPATLARDSGILRHGGYELTELAFYDFYPQTSHIESLALFAR